MMTGEARARSASILLIVTSAAWLYEWLPALFVAALVLWALLHKRLEGDLGQSVVRRWRRVWPPRTLVLVPLLLGGSLAYWVADVPLTSKVMPITLNVLALSVVLFGDWWRVFRRRETAGRVPGELIRSAAPAAGRAK